MSTGPEAGDEIRSYIEGQVGVVELNRPESRNALTATMLSAIGDLLATFESEPSIAAVVLTGAGGAFCAGGDVKSFAAQGGDVSGAETPDAWRDRRLALQEHTVGRLLAMQTPVLAALPGATAGAGLALALACHLRIGSRRTLMTSAFVKIGLSGDFGISWLLNQLAGPSRGRRIMLLSERIHGEEAYELGLIDWLVPAEELQERAMRLAAQIADAPQTAVHAIMANFRDVRAFDLAASMREEIERYSRCAASEEHLAAVTAFGTRPS